MDIAENPNKAAAPKQKDAIGEKTQKLFQDFLEL